MKVTFLQKPSSGIFDVFCIYNNVNAYSKDDCRSWNCRSKKPAKREWKMCVFGEGKSIVSNKTKP